MNAIKTLAAIIALPLMLCCSGGNDDSSSAIPRRHAYPRLNAYPEQYHTVGINGMTLEVNDSAVITRPGTGWLNISYPRYNATIYISVVATAGKADMAKALENRRQRISLNLNGMPGAVTEIDNGVFSSALILSPEAGNTPVQLLAHDGVTLLLSGTAVLHGNTAPADSIRPTVDAIARDALHMLQNLSR